MTKSVLVTGANGFTGSHLAKALVKRGDHVRVLVRPGSELNGLKDSRVQPVYADLANDLPSGVMNGVDEVYHVAALYRKEGVPRQYFFDVNAGGTERLLQAALSAGVKRFVHTSTVGVLGDIHHPPADETSPYNPHDVYQESKLEGEKIALRYHHEHGLPVSVVRPGAIYGPGDLRFLKLFRGIAKGRFLMIGSGDNDYHLVYIDDLVRGFLLAGERPEAVGEIFIIAGEKSIKVKHLAELIAEVLDRKLPGGNIPVAPVMVAAKVMQKALPPLGIEPPLYPRRLDFFTKTRSFDISKARHMLGYQPQVDLKSGLACTAEWYRKQGFL